MQTLIVVCLDKCNHGGLHSILQETGGISYLLGVARRALVNSTFSSVLTATTSSKTAIFHQTSLSASAFATVCSQSYFQTGNSISPLKSLQWLSIMM
jgi:deoxyinosine 3'endonuclease (endonuclease V)